MPHSHIDVHRNLITYFKRISPSVDLTSSDGERKQNTYTTIISGPWTVNWLVEIKLMNVVGLHEHRYRSTTINYVPPPTGNAQLKQHTADWIKRRFDSTEVDASRCHD